MLWLEGFLIFNIKGLAYHNDFDVIFIEEGSQKVGLD